MTPGGVLLAAGLASAAALPPAPPAPPALAQDVRQFSPSFNATRYAQTHTQPSTKTTWTEQVDTDTQPKQTNTPGEIHTHSLLALVRTKKICCRAHTRARNHNRRGADLKTDDDDVYGAETVVPLFGTWEARLPAPVGFTEVGPSVYNITQLNAIALITTPAAQKVQVRGFFMIPVVNSTSSTAAVVVFRFTPSQVGTHSIILTINDGNPVSRAFTATGIASPSSGFVRVAPNKQHFRLSGTNRTFFGVGENLAWQDGAAATDYDDHLWAPYLTNLSKSGANYIRVWLTDSWTDFYLENSLGNYSQMNAHKIDELLQMASAHGIRVLMCTESFNLFCSKPNPTPCTWDGCVYNERNGGMLATAGDFFTDPRAIALYEQRLQYLVARFSHSTAVFAWEFFNEVDITDGYTPGGMAVWTKAMATYLRSIDPYSHPISTSFCCNDPKQVWELEEMDFVMTHSYSSHNRSDMADNSQYWNVKNQAYQKPTYVAETGEVTTDDKHWPADPTGIGLHNVLWASMMSLGAMTSMTWWWDSWVACSNTIENWGAAGDDSGGCLYHHFTAVANFSDGVDFAAFKWKVIGNTTTPLSQCTDRNPGGHRTCQQQASYGKCDGGPNGTNPWMLGECCKTCHPNSTEACAACSAQGPNRGGGPSHKAVDLGSGARLFGMLGRPLSAPTDSPIAVMWVQNKNNTFTQQNATVPAGERPRLAVITGLKIEMWQFLASRSSFDVTFTDTSTGQETTAPKKLTCPTVCTVEVPDFRTDVAITLRPTMSNQPCNNDE